MLTAFYTWILLGIKECVHKIIHFWVNCGRGSTRVMEGESNIEILNIEYQISKKRKNRKTGKLNNRKKR
jgi:hypothetical protein